MAQKIKPTTLRIGITMPWSSRWFFRKEQKAFLAEDYYIRELIKEKIMEAGIAAIDIERTSQMVRVTIRAARPGLIIGRGGKGIDELRDAVRKVAEKFRKKNKIEGKFALNLTVEELRRSEISAQVMAQQLAYDIEKRMPYRRLMKRAIETAMQNQEVKGVKVKLGGRLNGAEISRTDWLAAGKMPLQTLRANIDYGEATAFNTYGTIGIKIWLYKGEIFAHGATGARRDARPERSDRPDRPSRPMR